MPKTSPFKLGIDDRLKRLRMIVTGQDGHESRVSLNIEQIGEFMATLSHCVHALVLAHAGQKIDMRTFDPRSAFEPVAGGYRLGAYEGLPQFAVGIDDEQGLVALSLRGSSDRLTGYRMSPDMARRIGQALLDAADHAPTKPLPKQ